MLLEYYIGKRGWSTLGKALNLENFRINAFAEIRDSRVGRPSEPCNLTPPYRNNIPNNIYE